MLKTSARAQGEGTRPHRWNRRCICGSWAAAAWPAPRREDILGASGEDWWIPLKLQIFRWNMGLAFNLFPLKQTIEDQVRWLWDNGSTVKWPERSANKVWLIIYFWVKWTNRTNHQHEPMTSGECFSLLPGLDLFGIFRSSDGFRIWHPLVIAGKCHVYPFSWENHRHAWRCVWFERTYRLIGNFQV